MTLAISKGSEVRNSEIVYDIRRSNSFANCVKRHSGKYMQRNQQPPNAQLLNMIH